MLPPKRFWRKNYFLKNFILYHPYERFKLWARRITENSAHCYTFSLIKYWTSLNCLGKIVIGKCSVPVILFSMEKFYWYDLYFFKSYKLFNLIERIIICDFLYCPFSFSLTFFLLEIEEEKEQKYYCTKGGELWMIFENITNIHYGKIRKILYTQK